MTLFAAPVEMVAEGFEVSVSEVVGVSPLDVPWSSSSEVGMVVEELRKPDGAWILVMVHGQSVMVKVVGTETV